MKGLNEEAADAWRKGIDAVHAAVTAWLAASQAARRLTTSPPGE